MSSSDQLISDQELELLLHELLEVHGYDFRQYTKGSLSRRISRLLLYDRMPSFSEFRKRLRESPAYFSRFLEHIPVNITDMFRDPLCYKAIREHVIPHLAEQPFIRIWHAGCSTGQEVYSMAILLQETGLLQKSLLYATDIKPQVIETARKGIFPLEHMKHYSENYIRTGGIEDFSRYYTARYDKVIFNEDLRSRMIFATHNLVSDASFNEFQLIFCRNVMIYFNKSLQDKVLLLFDNSLATQGHLVLGPRETLRVSPLHTRYEKVGTERIWKKNRG